MARMGKSIVHFARKEAVLVIAFLFMCASAVAVPPSAAYASYIDMRVIVLLFCLMAVVAGLRASGLLSWCATRLLVGGKTLRSLVFALVMLPFFASMLVTNDVALIAFCPLAVMVLGLAGERALVARVVVLQAIAANLGGMATPMGNPQNLFVYLHYQVPLPDFMLTIAPYAVLAFLGLAACCAAFGSRFAAARDAVGDVAFDKRRLALFSALFLLCVLGVARIVSVVVLLAVVVAALLLFDRGMFARVDYGLLLTFACFFVFSGNMAAIPFVREVLQGFMEASPFLTSVAASQVISNVPAAVLLSQYTGDWQSLLVGVDVGGLGTPIASLASLIAYRLYMTAPGASTGAFMREFALANGAGLVALFALRAVLRAAGL